MKQLLLLVMFTNIIFCSFGQILKISTTPTLISSQIPGYSQLSTITTKTYPYTASNPSPNIIPIDEDSTTKDDKHMIPPNM